MKYILTYDINDYPGNGGGTYVEEFITQKEMLLYLNEEILSWGERIANISGYEVLKEIEFEPVERVTEYKIKDK